MVDDDGKIPHPETGAEVTPFDHEAAGINRHQQRQLHAGVAGGGEVADAGHPVEPGHRRVFDRATVTWRYEQRPPAYHPLPEPRLPDTSDQLPRSHPVQS